MRVEHPYSLLVRTDDLAWTCGQCPLAHDGAVLAPDDLGVQADHVADYISRVLDKAEFSQANVGKLVLYHAPTDPADTERMLNRFQTAFPGAVLMPVGTPFFYYPGMRLEVDAHAAERRGPLALSCDDVRGLRIKAVDGDDLAWVGLEVLVDPDGTQCRGFGALITDVVRDALDAIVGVSPSALVADHWFVTGDGARPALERLGEAGLVTDPGAAVSVTLPSRVIAMGELTFARDGNRVPKCPVPSSSGTSVFVRHSRKHFWIAARSVSPTSSLISETEAIMASIAETMRLQGWSFDAVCKATTHYVGSSAARDLHDNMEVRNAYYSRPGPASTGLPVAAFPFSSSKIAVNLLGIIE
jgi:enamine deaminase RidA (YjgF/YER057c/UK114 family)